MAQYKEPRAPYNFIPFDYTPIARYHSADELPAHDKWESGLLSGEIQVTLTAETPVFVGGRERDQFAEDACGNKQIPASSLRGLIRTNMQILGCGLVRTGEDIFDRRLLYRCMDERAKPLDEKRKAKYMEILGDSAKNVKAGYLYRPSRDCCYIVPVRGEVYRLSREDPLVCSWKDRHTFSQPVYYFEANGRVTALQQQPKAGCKKGVLVGPGRMRGQNSLYLFPEEDRTAPVVPVTDEDRLSYEEDLRDRKNTLRGTDREHPMDPDFWKLPMIGQSKPIFYIRYQDQGVTVFGMNKYLRLAYTHSLGEGLPSAFREQQDALFLDYPYAVMGFAAGRYNYRSRISVDDLPATYIPEQPVPTAMVLGQPRPSFFANYVKDGKDYNQEDFRLNGIKQYWLKSPYAVSAPNPKVNVTTHPLPKGTRFTGTIRYRNLHEDELGLLLWCLRLEEGCFQSIGMGKPYGFGRVRVSIDSLREYSPETLYSGLTQTPAAQTGPVDRVEELIRRYKLSAGQLAGLEPDAGITKLEHIQDFLYMKRCIRAAEEVSYMSLRKPITRGNGKPGKLNEFAAVERPLKPVRLCRRETEEK